MDCKKTIKPEVKRIPQKVNTAVPNGFAEIEISKLKTSVSNMYYNKKMVCSYQGLYNIVENLCTLNQDEDIYNDLKTLISEFLQLQLVELVRFEEIYFLHKLKELWLVYCHKSGLVQNVYLYLEFRTARQQKRKVIIQMCMDLFKSIILNNELVKKKFDYVFILIESERDNKTIDTKLIKDIITMFDKLGLYDTYFEKEFLVRSDEYYEMNSEKILNNNILEYFYYAQLKLSEEELRIKSYLLNRTQTKLKNNLYKILIEDKLTILITKLDNADIFHKCDINDIIVIYDSLIILPKGNKDFCTVFSKYMMNRGSELVFDTKNEGNLIGNLLEFKDRIDDIVQLCFKNNVLYTEAVRCCFKKFINQRKFKPSQLLAKFIDGRMRDKLIPEELLDKIMVLFRYIQGKDVFEAYYKRFLAKRLLLGKSSSQDAEKYMISKLKLECGDSFTSKLEGMFRDIDLSDNLTLSFKQRYVNNFPIEFTAHVLTSSFWPTFIKSTVTLPDKMLNYQNIFHDFYKAKYSGRSLQWLSNSGTCLVKALLQNGNKEFQVSLFQALVLLLFNENDKLTYKSIKLYLNLDDAELLRTMLSLACGKIKILTRVSTNGELNDDHEFIFNKDFTSKLYRIRINQLQYKETEEEQKITEDEVMHDRHLQIDAALVRLMKQHQGMRHSELIANMYSAVQFPLNPNDIKKRIEILIERDFLARNPDDPNAYLYVA